MSFPTDPSPGAVYYGAPTPEALAALGQFGRVFVQAALYSPEQLARLRSGGTQVLAYLSVGEDHPLGDWACVPGSAAYHGGLNPDWGSVVVDAAHPLWRRTLLERAASALAHSDGLLLDTLDSAAPPDTLELVRRLRAEFPGVPLWANRGFSLWPGLPDLLRAAPGGGVLFEAFSTHHTPYALHGAAGLEYTAFWLKRLRHRGLDIQLLDYADTPALARAARTRAAAFGLPTFVSDRALSLPGGWAAPPQEML